MTDILDSYLNTHFSGLVLEPPLFYNTQVGIRFELGKEIDGNTLEKYLTIAQTRAKLIYEEIFHKDSDILVVVRDYADLDSKPLHGKEIYKYIKNSIYILVRIDEQKEDAMNYRHILKCKGSDIDYQGLIKAQSHQDFALAPAIKQEVYLINLDKHMIYQMYDDTGLDIISNRIETLRPLYLKFNDWILDYDRKRIDELFITSE